MTRLSLDQSGVQSSWLVFALGPYLMCASALDVEGIIQSPGAIAKLPLMPDYALGAFLFRERSAAAISLRKKLKLREGVDRATGPFIVARVRDSLVAFCVDEVRDVIDEKDAEWRALPSLLEGALFARLAARDGQLILQTSFAALRDAEVEFESFTAQLAACVGAELAPAASSASNEGNRTVPSPDAASAEKLLERAPEGASAKEVRNERNESSVPSGRVSRVPARTNGAEARAAGAAPKVGRVRNGTSGTIKPDVRSNPPAAPLPELARQDEQHVRPAQASGSEAATVPIAFVMPETEVASLVKIEKRNGAKRISIATAVAIGAVAGILYTLMPSSRERATLSPASALPSAVQSSPPALAPVQPPMVPIVPSKPDAVLLTLQAAPGTPERLHEYTVVRGDTLWQIAKKHVGDPFQYPELAKLSDIRNPDLIHPGDLVRIEIRARK